jgi:hypothetical protein
VEITNNDVTPKSSEQLVGRLTGLCLMITIAAPMIIAYWIYHTGIGIPDATVNKGTLLFPATDIRALSANDLNGESLPIANSPDKRWRILIPIHNQCDESCADNIYTTRQVYKRLAKESHRIERFLIQVSEIGFNLDPGFIRTLEIEDPALNIARVEPTQWLNLFSDTNAIHATKNPSIILVDQDGFAMMIYNESHTGNDLLSDLSRLLRYTYE